MIKLNSKFLLIAAGLITFANADCTKDEIMKLVSKDFSKKEIKSICNNSKNNRDTEWIKLSEKTCTDSGGEMYSGVCLSTWSDANKICSIAGGRLASKFELKDSIIKCGGMIDECGDNVKSESYQSCTKEDGFSAMYDYWSSTSCKKYNQDAWVAYISSGDVYTYDKDGKSYVRCVKDAK